MEYFFVREKGNILVRLVVKDIFYILAMGDWVQIFHEVNGKLERKILQSNLTKIINKAISPKLFRCSRSAIINIDRVIKVSKSTVYLERDKEVPLGEFYRRDLLTALNYIQFINLKSDEN